MTKSTPTVTHLKAMSPCKHTGISWNVALALAIQCMDTDATIPQRNGIVQQLIRGEAVWLGGHLLHGELS